MRVRRSSRNDSGFARDAGALVSSADVFTPRRIGADDGVRDVARARLCARAHAARGADAVDIARDTVRRYRATRARGEVWTWDERE
jgi:hypothetical protein